MRTPGFFLIVIMFSCTNPKVNRLEAENARLQAENDNFLQEMNNIRQLEETARLRAEEAMLNAEKQRQQAIITEDSARAAAKRLQEKQ